ncbi:isoprenoid synthase domain-containing protein [Cristinia sonorae]|uniref:Isoprenoid synthase domain-containing protein n=1 Tax=Cristinia sonorae TaxID=1940300 RepID=A0A8K0UMW4_9AGAR|nr:isoprenoid synthase domain-containing protein [Cristinia sonorae]
MAIIPESISGNDSTRPLRQLLVEFFERSGIPNRFRWNGMDPIVRDRALERAKGLHLGISDNELERYLTVGLVIAVTAFGHTPRDVQVEIALYTFFCTMADDSVMSHEMLREFVPRIFRGEPQLHPILAELLKELSILRQYFTPYSSNIITTNTMDFFSAEMFLRDEGGSDSGSANSTEYVDYIRWKTGIGEAYAAFIWPCSMFPQTKTYIQAIPDAIQFICLCNDLLSYYKEAQAGETDNYVSHRTAGGQSPMDTLEEMVNRLVVLDGRIKAILGEGAEKAAWESFASGPSGKPQSANKA